MQRQTSQHATRWALRISPASVHSERNIKNGFRHAQKQPGHGSITMVEHYVRKRRGEKAGSTR